MRLAYILTLISKTLLTYASLSCSAAYNDKTLISALSSRMSNLEYLQASSEETSNSRLSALENQIERFSTHNEQGPFENLQGWTKIDSDASKVLYYRLLDTHGAVNFLTAMSICKEFKQDSNLIEIQTSKELEGFANLAKGKKKYFWLNGFNSKETPNKQIDFIWLNSGKVVDPELWNGTEGTNANERCITER